MTEIERPRTFVEIEESTMEGKREMAAARAEVRVGHLLKKAFRVTGISQKDLAKRLGVTEGRVSQILNSDGNLRVSTAARYLRAMGYLMQIEAEPAEPGAQPLRAARRRNRRAHGLHAFSYGADPGGRQPVLVLTDRDNLDGVRIAEMRHVGHVTNMSGQAFPSGYARVPGQQSLPTVFNPTERPQR